MKNSDMCGSEKNLGRASGVPRRDVRAISVYTRHVTPVDLLLEVATWLPNDAVDAGTCMI